MNHRSRHAGRPGLSFLSLLLLQLICRPLLADGVQLYRCDMDGEIEFRQTACEQGDESITHLVDSNRGMTPSVPGLRLKKSSEKTDTVLQTDNQSKLQARCWRKRRQLERVERHLRSGYKPSQSQRLHDRQDDYEAYIRHFCR
jgi:hypothetical protein